MRAKTFTLLASNILFHQKLSSTAIIVHPIMPKRKLETPSSRTLRSASSTSSPRSSSSSSPPSKPPVKRTPSKSNKKAYSTKIPADFKSLNDLVTELRADKTAPVDSAGAEVICQQPPLVPIEVYHFQVLIALMLSSQTKDAVVSAAMAKMQTKIPGGLTVQSVSAISDATLDEHIHSVGFHNNKVKYIKKACETIIKDYSGEIPNTSEGLCSLAGVGPKMAHLVMNVAFNEITGIGVDTHMHRIFNILKWVNSSQPDNTRQQVSERTSGNGYSHPHPLLS